MGDSDLGSAGGVEFWRAEAARWRVKAERPTADDLVYQARVADLEGQVSTLTEKVSVLARPAFGKSSEKTARRTPAKGQGRGAGRVAGEARLRAVAGFAWARPSGLLHLRTREEVHDVPEGERVCPCYGAGYAPFGEETCEQIDWWVQPATPTTWQHRASSGGRSTRASSSACSSGTTAA